MSHDPFDPFNKFNRPLTPSEIREAEDRLIRMMQDMDRAAARGAADSISNPFHTVKQIAQGAPSVASSKVEDILRKALNEAKIKLKEQNDMLEQLLSQSSVQGTVVHIGIDYLRLSIPGYHLTDVMKPTTPINDKDLMSLIQVGSTVRLITKPDLAIVDVLPKLTLSGEVITVSYDGVDGECKVEYQGMTRIIRYPSDIKKPEVGDRLLVDSGCNFGLRNLGPDETKFTFQGLTGVSWDDVGGLVKAKEALREAVELPYKHPDLYKRYGKKSIKGVMLSGPPGCGKTMLAKAVATAIADIHNKKGVETGFIYVKGPEMLDKYVGNTEAQVRALFSRARKHHAKFGYPAVIFIDEADAILGKRGGRPGMGIEATVVPQFLAEMDGLDETGAIVLLSTNRPDSLDSAVTRDGRIDHKVQVTRPDQKGTEEIFKLYLKKTALAPDQNVDTMAAEAAACLFSSKYKIYDLLTETGSIRHFTLSGLVNGAMIAGMIDKASTLALQRDIRNAGTDEPNGLVLDDLRQAADSLFSQNLHLNHQEEIQEFIDLHKLKVKQATKSPADLTA